MTSTDLTKSFASSQPDGPDNRQRVAAIKSGLSRWKMLLLLTVLAIKIALLIALSFNAIVVMDEFVQLGYAKYLGSELFSTIWPVKAVGYAVFYKLAHLVGWDAVSTVVIGRVMTAALGCGVVAMVYHSARALGSSRSQALVGIVVLLSFSNFIERIFRTRAEPLAVFFAVASLLVVLRGGPTARRILGAGVLTGLAFITTQKSIYFNVALGVALVVDAAFNRDWRYCVGRGALLISGWLLPVIAYCFIFGGLAPLPVAHNLFFGPSELVSDVPRLYEAMGRFVLDTLTKNVILYMSCIVGMCIAVVRIRQLDNRSRIALIFSVLICAFVYSHNQPWPYVFVMALPFLVLWIPTLIEAASGKARNLELLTLILGVAVALSFVRNVQYLMQFGNAEQFSIVRNAERLTAPNEIYFDGVGILPNRDEPTALWLDRLMVQRSLAEGEASELYEIFQRVPPRTLIWSYRMALVEPVIRHQLNSSYVKVAANIRVPGRYLEKGSPTVFDVPISGRYALYSSGGQALRGCIVYDGKVIEPPLFLPKGNAKIELTDGPDNALLVQEGQYQGIFDALAPDYGLFDKVYD
ncbi:hypothetical protein IM511_03765 [Erythrobacteraceae bacterium E2-1 Yellow Sea]|nr:hypothetical protein [Erythrobacteraceae bacterium E2-1 Yellow Sea]